MRFVSVLCLAVASLAGIQSAAAAPPSAQEKALGKYVFQCDSRGKPEAVYDCALERSTGAGDLSPDAVAACREEIPSTARNPNAQIWKCAIRRQFAGTRSLRDWWRETGNECTSRSMTAGHRYQGRVHDCVIDTAIAEGKVTDAQVQDCRSSPKVRTAHLMRNCLQQASMRAESGAVETGSPAVPAAREQERGNGSWVCRANLGRNPQWDEQTRNNFMSECVGSSRPPREIAASMAGHSQSVNTPPVEPRNQQDDAEYPAERVRTGNRNYCESTNRSGALVYDCTCISGEVDRHLAQGKLPRKVLARHEFDWTPCIDRVASADKFVASNFNPGAEGAMRRVGVDVEAYRACQHRAIAQDIPLKSLTSRDYVRSEIKRLCTSKRR